MKRVFAMLLLLFAGACAVGADSPDNGIYLREQGEPAPWIMSQDGQKLFFGSRQDIKVQKSELLSQDNANAGFYLSLTIPYDAAIDSSTYVLIVDGTAYRQSGSGALQEKASSISFYIAGEEKAKQVAAYFGTPLLYRRHPRHNLLVSFTPAQQEFPVGVEVTVTLRIANVGKNSISFVKGGRNRASRDNQYVFSARYRGKQVEDIGSSDHFGGMSVKYVLKPGQVFEDEIGLSRWFAFAEPGMYEVHGAYYLAFTDLDADSWRTIWEDYASADFLVVIK